MESEPVCLQCKYFYDPAYSLCMDHCVHSEDGELLCASICVDAEREKDVFEQREAE